MSKPDFDDDATRLVQDLLMDFARDIAKKIPATYVPDKFAYPAALEIANRAIIAMGGHRVVPAPPETKE